MIAGRGEKNKRGGRIVNFTDVERIKARWLGGAQGESVLLSNDD